MEKAMELTSERVEVMGLHGVQELPHGLRDLVMEDPGVVVVIQPPGNDLGKLGEAGEGFDLPPKGLEARRVLPSRAVHPQRQEHASHVEGQGVQVEHRWELFHKSVHNGLCEGVGSGVLGLVVREFHGAVFLSRSTGSYDLRKLAQGVYRAVGC